MAEKKQQVKAPKKKASRRDSRISFYRTCYNRSGRILHVAVCPELLV